MENQLTPKIQDKIMKILIFPNTKLHNKWTLYELEKK